MVFALVGDSTITRSNLRPPVAGAASAETTAVVLRRRTGAAATAVAGTFRVRLVAGAFTVVVFFLGTESTPIRPLATSQQFPRSRKRQWFAVVLRPGPGTIAVWERV